METYEEKYKDLVKRLNKAREEKGVYTFNSVLDAVAPELKESEDEIRKAIISFLKSPFVNENITDEKVAPWIAWLEKQGEQKQDVNIQINPSEYINDMRGNGCYLKNTTQKPANKVEPKFKVGDWVVRNDETLQISGIDTVLDGTFHYWFTKGTWLSSKKMENAMLWTIQDAKAGDVLSYNDGHGNDCIELIKSITGKKIEFWFCLTNGNSYEVFDGIIPYTNLVSREDATPATKEQRNLLFQKMKEADYEWDAEKKELKKIEQKPDNDLPKGEDYGIDGLWHAERILEKTLGEVEGYQSDDGILEHKCAISSIKELKKIKQQNWSEEDEMRFNNIFTLLEELPLSQNWLKSLKDRVQTKPKQEWNEEDNAMLISIENILIGRGHSFHDKEINWLKSLRPKSQWKPSDEQISVLSRSLKYINTISQNYCHVLGELFAQLKKLREK